VFWDIENVSIPQTMQGHVAALKLRNFVNSLRFDIPYTITMVGSAQSTNERKRRDLIGCGVQYLEAPHAGRKELADKILFSRMYEFALDNPPPATIVCLTGDSDFDIILSSLRMRRYKIIIILPINANERVRLSGVADQAHSFPEIFSPELFVSPTHSVAVRDQRSAIESISSNETALIANDASTSIRMNLENAASDDEGDTLTLQGVDFYLPPFLELLADMKNEGHLQPHLSLVGERMWEKWPTMKSRTRIRQLVEDGEASGWLQVLGRENWGSARVELVTEEEEPENSENGIESNDYTNGVEEEDGAFDALANGDLQVENFLAGAQPSEHEILKKVNELMVRFAELRSNQQITNQSGQRKRRMGPERICQLYQFALQRNLETDLNVPTLAFRRIFGKNAYKDLFSVRYRAGKGTQITSKLQTQ